MNGRDAMAALNMRLRWGDAMQVQPQEPERASAILAELLVQTDQDDAQAQKNGLYASPLTIADHPDLVREWASGHDDAARGAHALACDCATGSCPHLQRKPVGNFHLKES